MKNDINLEWLDVEDIVWDIFDKNQSKWGHSYNECKRKIMALKKAKELTSLFNGMTQVDDLNEIIEMKIKCLTRDYFVPVSQQIKNEVQNDNLNLALFIAHSELKNIVTSEQIIPNSNKMIKELKSQCKVLEGNRRKSKSIKSKVKS
ncbi:MAG: hypothetical protein HND52_05715 [Ignavibacteriae bacterium]|nr:hypothetical protein [Ignavibacteriota bacterium]NOG97449.1 hypothetical protein [Ignavibacteriota bacterium]